MPSAARPPQRTAPLRWAVSYTHLGLSDTSKAMSCVLMLIGGSSGSTAGGLKTATVGVLLLALRSGLMGREQVTFRGRAIHYRRVLNAMTPVSYTHLMRLCEADGLVCRPLLGGRV